MNSTRTFFNYGVRTVDIAAPGTFIYSPWFSSDTYYLGLRGTSMAAPHVTGARLNIGNLFPRKPSLKALGSNTGLFRFDIGETNGAYVVEQSSNLGKWEPVANASVTNGIMTVPGTRERLFFRYRKL